MKVKSLTWNLSLHGRRQLSRWRQTWSCNCTFWGTSLCGHRTHLSGHLTLHAVPTTKNQIDKLVEPRIVDSNWADNPRDLPTRYMPPGNMKLLYSHCGFQVSFLSDNFSLSCWSLNDRRLGETQVWPLRQKVQDQMVQYFTFFDAKWLWSL